MKRSMRLYGAPREKEALDSMSPLTRKIVQRLGYQTLCMSDNEMADRANFRMIYEQESKRETETAMLPESVRAKLLQIGDGK